MKRNYLGIGIAGTMLTAALIGSVQAQGRPCEGMGPMGAGPMGGQGGPMTKQAGMKFDPAQRAERHLAVLKGTLKITPEQEPLWLAYADKMKAEAGKGFQAMHAQGEDAKLTAPERMTKMQSLMEERLAAMKAVHGSFDRLYAALAPEQKTLADQQLARMGQGMGGRGGTGPRSR